MSPDIPDHLQWLAPWEPVHDSAGFEVELTRETAPGHPLHGISATAVARRCDCDDVLFRIEHPSAALAVVHLTWTSKPERPPDCPWTDLFRDWEHWITDGMHVDARAHRGELP